MRSLCRVRIADFLLALLAVAGLASSVGAQTTTQVIEFYHTDASGSVRAVTKQVDGVWQVVRRYDFLPFGEEVSSQPPPAYRHLFTGKERDAETGRDYFGARYYQADTARFTTVDPAMALDENLVDPQRWNRYAYTLNNPLRYTDPDGRMPWPVIAQWAQRALSSPAVQRAGAWAQTQGVASWNWATRFFNSPTGQETVQTIGELVTGTQAPSAAITFGFSRVDGAIEGYTFGRLANGAEIAARFEAGGKTLTASVLGAFNQEGSKAAGTLGAVLQGAQAVAKQQGASQLII